MKDLVAALEDENNDGLLRAALLLAKLDNSELDVEGYLEEVGIRFIYGNRSGAQRTLVIRKSPKNAVTAVTAVTNDGTPTFFDDGTCDGSSVPSQVPSHQKGLGFGRNDGSDDSDGILRTLNVACSCGSTTWWKSAHGDVLCQKCGAILVPAPPHDPAPGAA